MPQQADRRVRIEHILMYVDIQRYTVLRIFAIDSKFVRIEIEGEDSSEWADVPIEEFSAALDELFTEEPFRSVDRTRE